MRTLLIIISFLLLSACNPVSKVSNQNLTDLYNPEKSFFHIDIALLHISDTTSQCLVRYYGNEFLQKRPNPSLSFASEIRIHCEVFSSYDNNKIIDSTSIVVIDSMQSPNEQSAISDCLLSIPTPFYGIARITVTDANRHVSQQFYKEIAKENNGTAQYFRIENSSNQLMFSNIFHPNDTAYLHALTSSPKMLYVKYFKDDFSFPSPPFVLENIVPIQLKVDSSFTISENTGSGFPISFSKPGIYFIQQDDTSSYGCPILVMYESYPQIFMPEQMMPPLRYITTQKEYDRICKNPDTRKAIDEFWLSIGGSPERARKLISLYYNRVIEANNYFTSYTEGWKTDRGMAYIIFGSPNILYRSGEGEFWVYGEERNFYSITLQFNKMQNPYTDNDYQLQRAPVYKDNWYRAVDIWRR